MKEFWRRFRKDIPAVVGLVVILVFALLALFANQIADYEEMALAQHPQDRLQRPSSEHWFGTDAFGRDIFARIIHGARISLTIGLASTFTSLLIGGFIGSAVAFYGGWLDRVVMSIVDAMNSIPGLLLLLAVVAALGPDMRNILVAITIAVIPGNVRLIRSAVLTVVDQDFVEAARACGTPEFRIIFRHILPNAIGPIIVNATLGLAAMILMTSGLSFLGMGVQPPTPEWGAMLQDGREYMRDLPYLVLFPGFAIILSVLSIQLIGNGLRDIFDPRLKD
jgi:peptide/nickel transport system permease protein